MPIDQPTVLPFIPQTITVHLGAPDQDAKNVTVPFTEYVKNVASSEIYPTWEQAALEANILAIISFALNRVYTEYYRSRGYDFDITNSTAIDQYFVEGRSYFDNISRLVDELFDTYIRRQGFVEPLATKFCNGTTSTCSGLSQWGSQEQARQGRSSLEILQSYYGDDIELVPDAPIQGISESYPGSPLRLGSTGPYVTVVQASLNRIGQNYPAIPKVRADSIFGPDTEEAVRVFQRIFSLTPDGIVGRATWYQLIRIYVAVLRLAELQSEGQQRYFVEEYPDLLSLGDTGDYVRQLQYMLSVISEFLPDVPAPGQTEEFDLPTRNAVLAFQRWAGLPQTGAVGPQTWDAIYEQFVSVEGTVFNEGALFPEQTASRLQQQPGQTLSPGMTDGGIAP